MKIQEPVRVSMRNASLKVGEIGLDRCLRKSMALLPTVLLFTPPAASQAARTLAGLHIVAFVYFMLEQAGMIAAGFIACSRLGGDLDNGQNETRARVITHIRLPAVVSPIGAK